MIKKIIIPLVTLIFTMVTLAIAAEGPAGNDRKGKYTYRKVYKACSETGGVESATPTLSPSNKKMAEWKTVFENKSFEEFGCMDNWAELSDTDILDIYSYFYNHAADSPSPATCK
jgi:hypothetical protein